MKYSVIIPIYNAEKTLRRCVDSLIEQNYDDAEIILINDGSQDDSERICRGYVQANRNIHLISQKNAGVSAARNTGLDAARGDYVLFVDSDDYVLPGLFEGIDKILAGGIVDLIRFSCCIDNGITKKEIVRKPLIANSREELIPHVIQAMCTKSINGPWAKLFRRELIEKHSIRFPVGVSVGEDRCFNIAYSFYIQNYIRSGFIGYVLNTENENSLSRKRHKDLTQQLEISNAYVDRELDAAPICEEDKERYRRAVNYDNCINIYHDAKVMIQDREKWSNRQRRLRQICKATNMKHMKYPKAPYCTMFTLPVRLYMTPIIDVVAKRLIKML